MNVSKVVIDTHAVALSQLETKMAEAEDSPKVKTGRLEDPEALRLRRDKVLERYQGFKEAAKQRREKLEGARKFQQFRRDADELESWIREKMQVLSDDAYKDRTNLQVRLILKKGAELVAKTFTGMQCAQVPQSVH